MSESLVVNYNATRYTPECLNEIQKGELFEDTPALQRALASLCLYTNHLFVGYLFSLYGSGNKDSAELNTNGEAVAMWVPCIEKHVIGEGFITRFLRSSENSIYSPMAYNYNKNACNHLYMTAVMDGVPGILLFTGGSGEADELMRLILAVKHFTTTNRHLMPVSYGRSSVRYYANNCDVEMHPPLSVIDVGDFISARLDKAMGDSVLFMNKNLDTLKVTCTDNREALRLLSNALYVFESRPIVMRDAQAYPAAIKEPDPTPPHSGRFAAKAPPPKTDPSGFFTPPPRHL